MARALRIFISYRRDDTRGDAHSLYRELAKHFGRENVFLDTESLVPGIKWLEGMRSRIDTCGVFLALIGPRWMKMLKEHEASDAEDYVRLEIARALERAAGVEVIPVLVGRAVAPVAERLPRSLHGLAETQAALIRDESYGGDIAALIQRLEATAHRPVLQRGTQHRPGDAKQPETGSTTVPPDDDHYETVLHHLAERGTVVPLLGTRINPSGPRADRALSLNGEELARQLAREFGIKAPLAAADLAEIAQQVYTGTGRPDLYRSLKQRLTESSEPGPVHRFLAGFPRLLDERGLPRRYPMIVTTAFDNALEGAFKSAGEEYDLAVYMASGPDKRRFVHFPWDGEATPIEAPNAYGKLPIDENGELGRTLIVKIHGAVDGKVGPYRWKENYVITEDHYIDYLSDRSVENLVPVQILDKLRDSHCLFLGYAMRDWSFRVFLKRVWHGEPLVSRSWAIERVEDTLEREFWAQFNVRFHTCDLSDYVTELATRLARRPAPVS